ncbi:hypothetical protein D3C78_669920 [compost metagenome]
MRGVLSIYDIIVGGWLQRLGQVRDNFLAYFGFMLSDVWHNKRFFLRDMLNRACPGIFEICPQASGEQGELI